MAQRSRGFVTGMCLAALAAWPASAGAASLAGAPEVVAAAVAGLTPEGASAGSGPTAGPADAAGPSGPGGASPLLAAREGSEPPGPERVHVRTSRPLADAGRALRTLASDTWFVATSPTRMGWDDAMWLAGTAAVTAVIYNNDEAILNASHRNHGNSTYRGVLRLGDNLEPLGLMGRTAPYYFGTMALGYALDVRSLAVIPAEILESHFIAGGVRNLSKVFIGRRRPFENQGPRAFEFDGGTSFPSGHTSVVFELATITSMHARRWPVTVAAYALASTVALQRVDSGNHWASDVVVPAVTGTCIARAIVNRHRGGATTLEPAVSPNGAMGARVTWKF